jgi:hypothetical protein
MFWSKCNLDVHKMEKDLFYKKLLQHMPCLQKSLQNPKSWYHILSPEIKSNFTKMNFNCHTFKHPPSILQGAKHPQASPKHPPSIPKHPQASPKGPSTPKHPQASPKHPQASPSIPKHHPIIIPSIPPSITQSITPIALK